jgi:hypothetical protein
MDERPTCRTGLSLALGQALAGATARFSRAERRLMTWSLAIGATGISQAMQGTRPRFHAMSFAPPMSIELSSRISVPRDVMASRLGVETVLLNLASEVYFGLDEIGTAMWEAARESPTVGHAYERLQNEFDVDGDRLKSDLFEFLSSLVNHGLLEVA